MKKTGVILSGCGFLDGSEIHEAVLTLLALDRAGIEAVMLAPDIPQTHTVNHRTGEMEEGQMRNVLDESARIARGAVTDLALIDTLELDALILPGGYGAAKNLSDYAFKGAECSLNPDVAHAIRSSILQENPSDSSALPPHWPHKFLEQNTPRSPSATTPQQQKILRKWEPGMSTARYGMQSYGTKGKWSAHPPTCWAPPSPKWQKALTGWLKNLPGYSERRFL